MGQRHQIYLATNQGVWEGPKGKEKRIERPKVYGIHHQWLYGHTAIRLLGNLIQTIKKMKEDNPKDWKVSVDSYDVRGWPQFLKAHYSVDQSIGYFHLVHDLNEEKDPAIENPYQGDNNDGITVIDIRGEEVAYCFYSLNGLEDEAKTEGHKMLTAREYVGGYYPDIGLDKDGVELKALIETLLARIENDTINLKKKDLKAIFPKLKKDDV